MSVTTEERSLRRRLVFNSVPRDLPVDIVQQCIGILENEFGSQPDIKYSQLIKRLNESIAANIDGNQMLGQIMIMRRKPIDEIGPDPGATGISPTAMFNPSDTIFNSMFNSITDQIQKRGLEGAAKFRSELPSQCQQAGISTDCWQALSAWSKSSMPAAISAHTSDFQTIINQCYVFMCAKFGPVEADKILHRSINQAEQLPESFEFSPKNLM